MILQILSIVFSVLFSLSLLTYFLPLLYQNYFSSTNTASTLKKKYGVEWALVTGSSSGIGKAIASRLASSGMNVVIASYPDELLSTTVSELRSQYPCVKFLQVGVDLSDPVKSLEVLSSATKDISIRVLINNAGYLKTGFFSSLPLNCILSNVHVNLTSVIHITHHYLRKMQSLPPSSLNGKRGVIAFTSSPAFLMPCPFSSMYGSTKAFLTEFAVSLAPEVRCDGIDVTVVHPSPVATNFYKGAHKLDAIEFFKSTASGPFRIADVLLDSIGKCVVRDQGYYPILLRVLLKIVDVNFISEIIPLTAHRMKDFQVAKKSSSKKS
jgi:short-subunit dehydrogenase